jgi:uncharacterized lipoprotein YajG
LTGWHSRAAAYLAIAAVGLISGPGAFARTQAQLTATFKDRDRPPGSATVPATCQVAFIEIVDARRSPEIVGVIYGRGVLAPKDTRAWLEAVLGGLEARGVHAVFSNGGPATASFTLQTAAIDSSPVTYSANVVIQVKAKGVEGRALEKVYRGRVSRTAYWSSGQDTMQSAVDGAFANALDAIALDLRAICGT